MKQKLLLYVLVAALVGAGIVWWGTKAGSSKTDVSLLSASAFSVEESTYDFGTISMKDGVVSRDFLLQNTGPDPIFISKAYTSCMCTTALLFNKDGRRLGTFGMPGHGGASSFARVTVPAGETVTVRAVFDPAAHGPSGVGLSERGVYLETNSKEQPKVEISFRAQVAP